MKRVIVSLLLTGMLGMTASAGGVGIYGSYWDPDIVDSDFGGGARLQLPIAPDMAFEIRGGYFEFDAEEVDNLKATLEVIPLEAALIAHISLTGQLRPYIGGGAGYYLIEGDVSGLGSSTSIDVDDEVGYFALAGAELVLADDVNFFAEAKYTWLDIEKIEDVEVSDDNSLDGFGVNVGLLFRW